MINHDKSQLEVASRLHPLHKINPTSKANNRQFKNIGNATILTKEVAILDIIEFEVLFELQML